MAKEMHYFKIGLDTKTIQVLRDRTELGDEANAIKVALHKFFIDISMHIPDVTVEDLAECHLIIE